MPAVGLEPTRGCPQQILSLPRLPFRHAGIETSIIISRFCRNGKGIFEFFLIFHKPRFRIHTTCLDQFLISGKQLLRKSDSYGFVDRKSFFSNVVQCCTVDPDHFDCRALVKSSGIYMSDTGRFGHWLNAYFPIVVTLFPKITSVISLFPLKAFLSIVVTL